MARIVFVELDEFEKKFLQNDLQDTAFTEEKLTEENVEKFTDAEILSTFIYSTLTKEVLEKMPKLKLIATRSTGFDHIDIEYCKSKNIIVSNVPSYGASTVAEHTFALILALSRKLIPSIERTRKGDFSLEGLTGFELSGKTIGVVGEGNIGSHVVRIAQAFGMKVIVFTHDPQNTPGVDYVTFEELLVQADVLTFHIPLTSQTRHTINKGNINSIKKGSLIINTARGGLIETEALLEGLEKGIFAGAGIDVLEEECAIREERELLTSDFLKTCDLKTQLLNHVLLDREDVLITPHNAFNSKESLKEIMQTTLENIQSFLTGKALHVVD